jgi:DNA-binding phage protein
MKRFRIDLDSFGQTLAAKTSERGLRQVAKETGVSAATLSRMQRGRTPDLHSFLQVCKWMGCNMEAFLVRVK